MLGLVGGLVVLALLVVFAVLLPQATGGPESLPDTLPGGLTAVDDVDDVPEAERAQAEDFAERQRGINDSGAEELEELFGAPAKVRSYYDQENDRQVTVTVVDTEAGPFLPNGPPFDASYLDLERNVSELVKSGDGVCALYYQEAVPEGQEITPDQEEPQAIQCQVGANGATYQLYGRGLDAEEAVEILDGLAA